jgi:hypothetical protein
MGTTTRDNSLTSTLPVHHAAACCCCCCCACSKSNQAHIQGRCRIVSLSLFCIHDPMSAAHPLEKEQDGRETTETAWTGRPTTTRTTTELVATARAAGQEVRTFGNSARSPRRTPSTGLLAHEREAAPPSNLPPAAPAWNQQSCRPRVRRQNRSIVVFPEPPLAR